MNYNRILFYNNHAEIVVVDNNNWQRTGSDKRYIRTHRQMTIATTSKHLNTYILTYSGWSRVTGDRSYGPDKNKNHPATTTVFQAGGKAANSSDILPRQRDERAGCRDLSGSFRRGIDGSRRRKQF